MLEIKRVTYVILMVTCCLLLAAQDDKSLSAAYQDEGSYITWVNQYPPLKTDEEGKAGRKIMNFFFGNSNEHILIKPVAVLAESPDNYWLLDQGSGTVIKIEDQVGDITHFRKKSSEILASLVGICPGPGEKILFSDSYLNKIFIYSPEKNDLKVLNDSLVLNRPTGVAYNAVSHEVWVVETLEHCVTILDEEGHFKKRIGRRGILPGEFNFPTSIWIDKFGKVFIVDAMNFRIQVLSQAGELLSVFGKAGDATGCLARPKGIATDSEGNIYVADALFNVIQIFDMQGNFLYKFGMQGQNPGEFWMPAGIYIDDSDFIYVADTYNARVQVFQFTRNKEK
jgi:DNA-binding beta-propeller fold protein YncE